MPSSSAAERPRGRTRLPGGERAVLAALGLAVTLLAVAPLVRLVAEAVAPGGYLDLAILGRTLRAEATWRALGHTLETGLWGTALALVLGGTFAGLVALTDLRGKVALVFVFMVPLMIAPQVTALAWSQAVGPGSTLLRLAGLAPAPGTPNPLHSREGIVLLFGVQHAPLVFLALRAGLRALPRDLVEAAQAAGAGPGRVLRTVILPLSAPALGAGAALAFVSCIGNFGIPALLGIPGRYTVLTTLVYQRLAGFGPAVLAEVAGLSLVLGVLAAAGLLAQGWAAGRRDVRVVALLPAPVWRLGRARPALELAAWVGLVAVVGLPVLALVATALVPAQGVPLQWRTATWANFGFVLVEHAATRRAFANSTALASGAAAGLTLLSVPLAYFLVWRSGRALRALGAAAELPYALPGVVLAVAMILLFLKPLPVLGVGLYNTPWILLVAYLARFLTLSLRPVASGYLQVDRTLEEAARMAGAGFGYRLRTVILPLVAPAAVAGALLVFLVAFNELTVSALLWSSGNETLGVVLFSLDQAGDAVSAAAVAVLSVAATLAVMGGATLVARRLPRPVLPWQA